MIKTMVRADLKSSPVLIVGFEILRQICTHSDAEVCVKLLDKFISKYTKFFYNVSCLFKFLSKGLF